MFKQLHKKNILIHSLVICLFVIVSVAFYVYVMKLKTEAIKSNAISMAKLYIGVFDELRSTYTSEVVATARRFGLNITHNYHDIEGAIPLPATFSMLIGEKISLRKEGGKVKLYSAYPFPWRSNKGGLSDEFEKKSWEALLANSKLPHLEFDLNGEQKYLRYSIADIMRAECINCHNTHPDTPKSNWKTGDVRGVLEVNIPLDNVINQVESDIEGLLSILVFSILLTYLLVTILVYKLRNNTALLEQQVYERTTDLNHQVQIRKKAEKTLQQRNTELQSNQLKLTYAIEQSKKADIAKNDFLANVSHELRTPLNGISGVCQLLKFGELTEKQGEYIDIIKNSVNDEVKIIDNILNMADLENSSYIIEEESFDLISLLNNELKSYIEILENKKVVLQALEMSAAVEREIPETVTGDAKIIRQIISSFLENACKFTEQGSIRTSIEIINQENNCLTIKISIKDTGIGIDKQDQETVFDKFLQANSSSTRQHGGTGLGLAICKQLAELIEATIGVESEPGKGSTFWLITTIKTSNE